jgi:hypothetical protein
MTYNIVAVIAATVSPMAIARIHLRGMPEGAAAARTWLATRTTNVTSALM